MHRHLERLFEYSGVLSADLGKKIMKEVEKDAEHRLGGRTGQIGGLGCLVGPEKESNKAWKEGKMPV